MKISPRCLWSACLGVFLAGCSSLQTSSRYTQFTAPASALFSSSERLRDETREYLKEEDRWFPKGRDVSLWESAQMVNVAGRNLQNGLTDTHLRPQELVELVRATKHNFDQFEYWTANVRVNENILRAMNEVRTPLDVLARNARALAREESSKKTTKGPTSRPASEHTTASFSPNDLNSAVSIAKAYLLEKYGIRNESIGNMRCQEQANHHEVVLETHETAYQLKVDVRKGKVLKEKSSPKAARIPASA